LCVMVRSSLTTCLTFEEYDVDMYSTMSESGRKKKEDNSRNFKRVVLLCKAAGDESCPSCPIVHLSPWESMDRRKNVVDQTGVNIATVFKNNDNRKKFKSHKHKWISGEFY